jgi:arginyl-tRNA synthetase
MNIVARLKREAVASVQRVYTTTVPDKAVLINETNAEFEGDFTLVTFALSKVLGKKPDDIATALGTDMVAHSEWIQSFSVVKGFLNFTIAPDYYVTYLRLALPKTFAEHDATGKMVMVEFSSPNTNKPLHFGHLRNNFLGDSMSRILRANGHQVVKANLINDRGIHICKSMVAWQHFAQGETPASSGKKGDHLVGDYYVRYNDEYKAQVKQLIADGVAEADAEKQAPILLEAQAMLRKWEAGDADTMALWQTMNSWVYDGFKDTYQRLGIDFDTWYYESKTYLLGKDIVLKGLEKGVLFKKEDGSVWIDLTADGLDQKLLLRGDGTSVYITQDIGTAVLKYNEHHTDTSVYVIGDEQNYHMQVLKLILEKMGEPCAPGVFHLSYGMVELPSGRMKSREGTVVDADDMIDEMLAMAKKNTEELGKVDHFTEEEKTRLYETLGLGALKFYLLRVDPKKKMVFNPQESIDFQGYTGPFVQYTYARCCSILKKAEGIERVDFTGFGLDAEEKEVVKKLEQYAMVLADAGAEYNPALICQYLHQTAKVFNGFLTNHSVLKAEGPEAMAFRLGLCEVVKRTLGHGLDLLGIEAPERM